MEALFAILPFVPVPALAAILITSYVWSTEIMNWINQKPKQKPKQKPSVVEREDEVFKWFEKIALLVEMGELTVTQPERTNPFGTVCFFDSAQLVLRLFQDPNWWSSKNQDRYICIDGDLKKDFISLGFGNLPRVRQTTPIHKFLKQPKVEKSQVDKMIDAAIEKHGKD